MSYMNFDIVEAHNDKISVLKFLDKKTFVSGSWDKLIKVWKIDEGEKSVNYIHELEHSDLIDDLILTQDNKYLIGLGANSSIKVWETSNFTMVMQVDSNSFSSSEFTLSPDGKYIGVPQISEWTLYHDVFKIPNSEKIQRIETEERTWPDNKSSWVLVKNNSTEFQTKKGLPLINIKSYLIKDNERNTILYNIDSKNPIKSFDKSYLCFTNNSFNEMYFSADCSLIASISNWYKSIKIILWKFDKKKYYLSLRGHKDAIIDLEISRDNQYLVSGSADKKVKLWDIKKGILVQTLNDHEDHVESVAISNDNKYILSGEYSGNLILWGNNS